MSKRKYHEISGSRSALSNKLSVQQQRQQESLRGHVENGQIQLLAALKLARGFERQKLGRRQKDARGKKEQNGNSKDGERIDAEIKALKALDLSRAAEFYVLRTLCRIKTIASSPIMPPELLQRGSAPSPYRDLATANVTARLFKSMAVRKAMEASEAEARKIVAPIEQQPGSEQASNTEQESTSKIEIDEPSNGDLEQSESESYTSGVSDREIKDLRFHQDSDQHGDDDLLMSEDEDFKARLASDSETESGSGDEDMFAGGNTSTDSHDQLSILDSRSSPPRPAKSKQQPSNPSAATTKPIKSTTFLPTLASGYFSGSDSDSYQSDNETAAEKPERRNRMGQLARRALAEQQYGSAANHLKNSKNNKKSKHHSTRDTGWDFKKGAVDAGGKQYGSRNNFRPYSASDPSYEQKEQKPKPRAKDDTGQLHPSWVAKKKMKEQQSQGINVYQGKKMTFD